MAKTKSHRETRETPKPAAGPFTAAINGLGHFTSILVKSLIKTKNYKVGQSLSVLYKCTALGFWENFCLCGESGK